MQFMVLYSVLALGSSHLINIFDMKGGLVPAFPFGERSPSKGLLYLKSLIGRNTVD